MYPKCPEDINLQGINAGIINVLSTRNILKFLEDHPQYHNRKGDIGHRIKLIIDSEIDPETLNVADIDKAGLEYIKSNLYIQSRGGIIDRETAEFILGDLSDAFFKEMAKSKEHIFIALKAIQEFECSLK